MLSTVSSQVVHVLVTRAGALAKSTWTVPTIVLTLTERLHLLRTSHTVINVYMPSQWRRSAASEFTHDKNENEGNDDCMQPARVHFSPGFACVEISLSRVHSLTAFFKHTAPKSDDQHHKASTLVQRFCHS